LATLAKDYNRILDGVTGQPFRGPTLFITGGQSRYVQDKDKPLIRELFPFHEHVVLPEAGHWLHAEQPDAFYREVNAFLQRQGF
jgi:pimeloyl-ACP methyl ester carboxylesterase